MKRRSTKSALLMSAISLLLCVSMLIGSTFAWFTDSVTSANNIIKSGNLDVEMYWADGKEAPTSANWTDASTGAIFNYSLWEPGYVQVRHIKIANEGSLALKYNIQIKANGVVSDLSDVIDVYYMDPAAQVADRTALTEANKLGTLTEVLENMSQTANGELIAGAEDTITLALKMQESAGNEYMNKSIGTDFSVVLLATQLTAEVDSFNDQYDKDSQYPEVNIGNVAKNENEATSVKTEDEDVLVDIPAVAPKGNYALVVSDKNEKTDAEGNTTVSMDISLLKDGVKVSDGNAYTVSVKIGAGMKLTKLTHNSEEITNYTYDMASGVVTFTTTGFSPFSFTYKDEGNIAVVGNKGYTSLADAVKAGGEVVLLEDVSESFASIENVTIKTKAEGGVTITNTSTEDIWFAFNNVTLGSDVTLVMPNVLITSSTNVIEGTLVTGAEGTTGGTYYQRTDAKTTVQNGGKIVVNGDVILRYNNNGDAGIYIYGDNDAATVEFSTTGYIGAYSGAFYAEDAEVTTGTDLRLDFYDLKNGVVKGEEDDKYAPITAEFVNATVNVAGQLRLYKDANLVLTNNSNMYAGLLQVRAAATPVVTVDASSVLKAAKVENVTGAFVEAVLGEDGTVSFKALVAKIGTKTYDNLQDAIDAATSGSCITLLCDVKASEGISLAEGVTLDGGKHTITYAVNDDYHLIRMYTGSVLKNVTLKNYRVRTENTTNGVVTMENVTIDMDNDLTGLDISRGAGTAKLKNVVCKGTKDAVHLDPNTQVQVDYTPYGDVLLGSAWALEATGCDFGSLHGWNTRNGSSVSLNNTTYTVFRMHYWSGRTLYINGVETAWSESGAIPVAHDVGGCWSVQPAFK